MRRAATFIVLLTWSFPVLAQLKRETSAVMVLRDQLRSMAQEVVAKAPLDRPAAVFVSVETEQLKTIAENAFLEVLTGSGFTALLNVQGDAQVSSLRIAMLEQVVVYRELPQGTFERNIRQTLEARFERRRGEPVSFLGVFTREAVDSVSTKENGWKKNKPDEPGIFEQAFSPLVVIAASVAIIYFLFSVRS
ncbi:MAG: hypothetical protein HY562_09470 [Ignavibacteriales bacterium]|nr:hypothetical protein [Ignavibacteriales bacterium]